MSIIPKIFERKIREYPSLALIKTENRQSLRYKERESPVLHIEQVSKNIGEHDRLQSMAETFTGQATQCQGYPSVETTNVIDSFNILHRNIWREEANKSGTNTNIHTRTRP